MKILQLNMRLIIKFITSITMAKKNKARKLIQIKIISLISNENECLCTNETFFYLCI